MEPGDRVRIAGVTKGSFRPIVIGRSITVLRHGAVLKPLPVDFDAMIHSKVDCRLVTVHGVIRAADVILSSNRRSTNLELLVDGSAMDVVLENSDPEALKGLLDAEAEITGVVSGRFDGKMQATGVLLHAASLADVKILKPAHSNPWSLPITPMDEIIGSGRVLNLSGRVRVEGTITYYHPGSTLVLQSGNRSLLVMTMTRNDLHVGDLADVTGFPTVHDGFLAIERGEIEDTHVLAPVRPFATTLHQLTTSRNIFDLVSLEGTVVTKVREAAQDEYVVAADNQLFSAIWRHDIVPNAPLSSLPPLKEIAEGSKVRVTGICIAEDSNPFNNSVPFNILLGSFDDIVVVAKPSWVNVHNLLAIVSVLLVIVLVVSLWGWFLGRKVRRQSAALSASVEAEAATERCMAQLEQRRSRILEDINGTLPLPQILEEITAMTSFRLNGAPCWCEVEEGARLGTYPAEPSELRIVREPIPARSGQLLGSIFAGMSSQNLSRQFEEEALLVGAGLATLAIETRRLYSDLLHRSEFDLLTDIHNRFSLDKHVEQFIEEARRTASIFGLIYIDLDEFKQVNDNHGHHIGDLYLQEASRRMKHQLRGGDQLARLGGDEFAALLPEVRNRAEVEEIAKRLEHCFDSPFSVDGVVVRGSASLGIALYPEDGCSKNSLLTAADAAMYRCKHAKRKLGLLVVGPQGGLKEPCGTSER
jgi:diguanylate cyclase (GGDEF)-like protein